MAEHRLLEYLARAAGETSVRAFCKRAGVARSTLYYAAARRLLSASMAAKVAAAAGLSEPELQAAFAGRERR